MVAEKTKFDREHVVEELKAFTEKYPTKGEAADALGVSRVFLWRVLEGKREPTDAILQHIGYKRIKEINYTYEKVG